MLGQYRVPMNFDLPFSWEVFFYSAVAASAANLIYLWKCPPIVKDYPSYLEFKEQGKGNEILRKEFSQLITEHYKKLNSAHLQKNMEEYYRTYCDIYGNFDVGKELEKIEERPFPTALNVIQMTYIIEPKLPEAFWFIRNFADDLNPGFRIFCFLFYALALLLVTFVMLQNIWFVLRYTFGI